MPEETPNVPMVKQVPGGLVLKDPTGKLVVVPQEEAAEDLQRYQFTVPSAQEVRWRDLQKQYGEGFGNEIKAAGLSVLSGATFGLGDLFLHKGMLIDPEAARLREEFSPVVSGLGQLGGIIGSTLLGGGLIGAVGKGATALGRGAASLAFKKGVARAIAETTIAGSAEGAAYGLGQTLHESALGDPILNAQKIWPNIGMGAIAGGLVGSVLGVSGRGKSWLRGKYGRGTELPEAVSPEVALPMTAEAEALPKVSPIKLEGTIDFGLPDEKVLERAVALNPKSPLKQRDLDWIKRFGEPDASGRPTVFKKIGTAEVPTLDIEAIDQTRVYDVVKQGMQKLNAERIRLNTAADAALEQTAMPNGAPLSISRNGYRRFFTSVMDDMKTSGELGSPPAQRAYDALEGWATAADNESAIIPATKLRDKLQLLRNEQKLYTGADGIVKTKLREAQSLIDQYLKENSPGYKAVQDEFAPFTRKMMDIEDHFGWDWDRKDLLNSDSKYVTDWILNRVAKPFQSSLPGTAHDAELMRWFSPYTGVDLEKAVKANLIYGKLDPASAQAGQLGTWGSRVVEGLEALQHPQAIPGQMLKGVAKVAITGEMPSFIQEARTKAVQAMLLGNATKSGSRGLGAAIQGALKTRSDIFTELTPLRKLLVPTSVKALQLLDPFEDVDEKTRHIETLVSLERARNDADAKILKAVKGLFADDVARPTLPAGHTDFLNEQTAEKHGKEWQSIYQDINQLVNDPALFAQRITEATAGLDESAPGVSSAMSMTAMRALQLLQTKLRIPDRGMLDRPFVPSKQQLTMAAKILRLVNNPFLALEEVKHGTISRDTKEVLMKVFPELNAEMQAAVMKELVAKQVAGAEIPTRTRLALSYFLDQDLDSTMSSASMQRNHRTMMGARMGGQNGSAPPSPRSSGAKHLGGGGRMSTPLDRVANR